MRVFYALSTALACGASASASAPPLIGNVSAVYALLERVIPGSSPHFALSLLPPAQACAAGVAAPCFVLSPGSAPGAEVALAGSSASELSAGVGHYLREYLNMTIGWPRGGGSNVFAPAAWPAPPAAGDARARVVPWVRRRRSLCRRRARSPHRSLCRCARARFPPKPLPPRARFPPLPHTRLLPPRRLQSYVMNVCTPSYSLVWYDWPAWERFCEAGCSGAARARFPRPRALRAPPAAAHSRSLRALPQWTGWR